MTCKEPQFSDDLNTPIAVAETTDKGRSDIAAENTRHVTPTAPAIELQLVIMVIRCGELMCFVWNGILGSKRLGGIRRL